MTDEEKIQRRIVIAEAVADLGLRGSNAEAIRRLVPLEDPDPALTAAAQAHVLGLLREPPAPKRRSAGPACPPGFSEVTVRHPVGFLTREEFMATPVEERLTPKFLERVRISRPRWPKYFNPADLPRGD